MYQDHTRSNKIPVYLNDAELASLDKKCASVGANRGKALRNLANHWANDRRSGIKREGVANRPFKLPAVRKARICLRQ